MLILGSRLIHTPILSLQTGTKLALTKNPIINPENLKIIAYEVEGPLIKTEPTFIRIDDIRELSDIGLITDSSDELINLDDVIIVDRLFKLNFKLVGKNVIDELKKKLGKVEDFSIDSNSFVIQQLHVKQGIIKNLTNTNLLINRSQIVEINDTEIIVRTSVKKIETAKPQKLNYLNPFRTIQ